MGFLGAVILAHRKGLDIDVARADIFGIYTAALDSTSNAANWLLAELAQNPEILRKAAKLDGEERKQYIEFILLELWRKDPITPIIFRQVPADEGRTMPDGTFLPPNTIVMISVGSAGLDPVLFPNPKQFNPDRYEGMDRKQIAKMKANVNLVFAGDKHRCQGRDAANETLRTLLEYLIKNFDRIVISPTKDGKKVEVQSNKSGVSSPVNQDGGDLYFGVEPKEPSSEEKNS